MYNSKYYTCEQIDQRLLEGYYDDAVAAGYTGSKAQYLAELLKAINYSANPTLTADKVVYNPAISGLTPKNVQGAIDELENKKADKASIVQEAGEAEDKVMSQKATTTAIADETARAKAAEKAIIFDVSVYNNGAVFESISALLKSSNLSTLIPATVRHGGMNIRFIQGSEQSSDNNYVQYFLTKNEWSASEADWQKLNLEDEVSQLDTKTHKNPFISNGCIIEMYVNSSDILIDDLHITKRNASGIWQFNFFSNGSSSVITNNYATENEASGIIPLLNVNNNYKECGYIIIDWSKVKEGLDAPIAIISDVIYDINYSPRISNKYQYVKLEFLQNTSTEHARQITANTSVIDSRIKRYVADTNCANELYIFDNSVGVVDLHLAYKNHNGKWFLKFFNNVDSTGISVAQTDVYTEEPKGIIPIYKTVGSELSNIIGYIDVNWSDIPNGATAILKNLLPAAFDEYSNPNISNLLSNNREKYDLKNVISLNDLSQNTASAVWELDGDVYKMTTYKGNGNALYKSIDKANQIIPSGHKFYFCENLKADGAVRFVAQISATNNSVCTHSGSGKYEFVSNIITINYEGGGSSLLITAARIEQQVSIVDVKDLMMIDLTAVFGKGNEPSKEYMDFYFKNRIEPFYGDKNVFSADNHNVKLIEDRVNDILVSQQAYAKGIVTAEMFTNPKKQVLASYINTAMYNFVYIVNKAGDISIREVLESDTIETICDKVNYSMRKDILFEGMSYEAMANAINKRATERIFRFADAKPLSDAPRNFNINTGINAGEPSAIVSENGNTLYLYAYLKRYSSKDGVNWSSGESLMCNSVNMNDKGSGNYLMHCNVNLINGTYYLFGCRNTTGGDLLLYTSTDGINFTNRGTALPANHRVGAYECINWGNTYLVYDYGSGYYYLYVEFEDSTIHWSIAVLRSTNPLNGSWVNAKEDVIIPPAYKEYNSKSNRFGSGNFDFVKGMDNQPIKSNGRYYAYYHGTCYDKQGTKHYNQSNVMRAYSYNLIDWFDEGVILDVRKKPSNVDSIDGDNTSGNADHCVIEFKGKSYMFYTYDINHYPAPEYIHTLIDDRPFSELLKLRP